MDGTQTAPASRPVNLTDEQRANLAKLAAYLRTLPANYPDFEMSTYVREGDGAHAHLPTCGTAACAVGHGPAAGIPFIEGESWARYSRRQFSNDLPVSGGAWDWCFSSVWSEVDNTVHGAAARIEHLLTIGLPENVFEQMMGDEPLSYSVEALS